MKSARKTDKQNVMKAIGVMKFMILINEIKYINNAANQI